MLWPPSCFFRWCTCTCCKGVCFSANVCKITVTTSLIFNIIPSLFFLLTARLLWWSFSNWSWWNLQEATVMDGTQQVGWFLLATVGLFRFKFDETWMWRVLHMKGLYYDVIFDSASLTFSFFSNSQYCLKTNPLLHRNLVLSTELIT